MSENTIFHRDLLICRGCDHISTIIMQNGYKLGANEQQIEWYELLNLENTIVRLSLYTEWAGIQNNSRDLIEVFSSIPGRFGEQTIDGNIIGLSGRFSAILQEDSYDESPEYYLGIHIPNKLTEKFAFDAAHYELNLLGSILDENVEETSILLAQGTISVIGDVYE